MSTLAQLLDALLKRRGTDLHLQVGAEPMGRVDGALSPVGDDVLDPSDLEAMLVEGAGERALERLRREKNLWFVIDHHGPRGLLARFRAHVFYDHAGLGIALRAIPVAAPPLEALEAPAALVELTRASSGLLLVSSARGGGRTALLASLVRHVAETSSRRVLTIERALDLGLGVAARADAPPALARIVRRQLGVDVPSVEVALESLPADFAEVVALEGLERTSVSRLAVRAALEGRLVLGTFRASDPHRALARLVQGETDSGVRGALLGSVLAAVGVSLVPGFDGARVAVLEVVRGGPELGRALGATSHEASGHDRALADLVQKKRVSYELARGHARDPDMLDRCLAE
jgi:twitching motility protein PilT